MLAFLQKHLHIEFKLSWEYQKEDDDFNSLETPSLCESCSVIPFLEIKRVIYFVLSLNFLHQIKNSKRGILGILLILSLLYMIGLLGTFNSLVWGIDECLNTHHFIPIIDTKMT